jgi:hypothetical protein
MMTSVSSLSQWVMRLSRVGVLWSVRPRNTTPREANGIATTRISPG